MSGRKVRTAAARRLGHIALAAVEPPSQFDIKDKPPLCRMKATTGKNWISSAGKPALAVKKMRSKALKLFDPLRLPR
jgi:hypothetical protein